MSTSAPTIQVVPYDPEWPLHFAAEAQTLTAALQGRITEVHHIGSTAVPGMSAKSLIDILVVVEELDSHEIYEPALSSLGYHHYPLPVTDRLLFIKGSPRTHHAHIVRRGGWHYWRLLLFCDGLKSDPAVARVYETLKYSSALMYPNSRDEYTLSKTEFITSTVVQLLHQRPDIIEQLQKSGEILPEEVARALRPRRTAPADK